MKKITRYCLLLMFLALPLGVGCGGHSGGTPAASEMETYFKENPPEPPVPQEEIETPQI